MGTAARASFCFGELSRSISARACCTRPRSGRRARSSYRRGWKRLRRQAPYAALGIAPDRVRPRAARSTLLAGRRVEVHRAHDASPTYPQSAPVTMPLGVIAIPYPEGSCRPPHVHHTSAVQHQRQQVTPDRQQQLGSPLNLVAHFEALGIERPRKRSESLRSDGLSGIDSQYFFTTISATSRDPYHHPSLDDLVPDGPRIRFRSRQSSHASFSRRSTRTTCRSPPGSAR